MSSVPLTFTWLTPWHPIANESPEDRMASELYREVGQRHALYGIKARAVGHRSDCDDILFELLDGSERLAVVHLTFSPRREIEPASPETSVFAGWSAFEREMRADAEEWSGCHG